MPASLLLQAAQAAAAGQQYPKGALYVVASPIGNLADLSLRAMHVLSLADRIACEDTRHSATLLRHLGLHKPLLAAHTHNERDAAQTVCTHLAAGERVALLSDAGTPAVSDPGARLVAQVREAGYRVVPIPGPSSALAALSVAGDTVGEGFRMVGFLPAKGQERAAAVARCLADDATQVLFEAPHRIAALAAAFAERAEGADRERPLTICRELTKQFEAIDTVTLASWPAWLAADADRGRGEFALVLHARPAAAVDEASLPPLALTTLRALLAELPLKQAVSLAAQISGAPRNALYDAALRLKAAPPADDDGAQAAPEAP